MVATERKIIVARIGASFKLAGEFKLFSWAEPIESIFDLSPWLIQLTKEQITRLEAISPDFFACNQRLEDGFYAIKEPTGRVMAKHLIGKIAGIDSPEAIAVLTNCEIYLFRSSFKPAESGSYYWCDLIGLKVVNQENHTLGVVKKLLETGANSILEIKPNSDIGKKETRENLLIPFVDAIIKKVDFKSEIITVDWVE